MSTDMTVYEPRDLRELETFAGRICRSGLVPQAYRNKPDDAIVAAMYGKECAGLGPMVSLQSIAVINGKPAFYGDALPGIAFNKGMITDMEESFAGVEFADDFAAICIVTRPSGSKVTQRFSVGDAKKAGLWGKSGPWTQYPRRMLQWRARSWAIRDAAPHLLFGPTVEELSEQPHIGSDRARDITPPPIVDPADMAVEVNDQWGQVELVMPGELAAWAVQRAGDCDNEENLAELLSLNPNVGEVAEAVEAERAKRTKPAPATNGHAAAKTLPLIVGGKVEGQYHGYAEWLAGLELVASSIAREGEDDVPVLRENLATLGTLARSAKTPVDLKLRAEALVERAQ